MKILLFITSCFLGSAVYSQNVYRFSQFNSIKGLYNPASIGVDAPLSFDLIYRNQWFGIDGAPQTAAFSGAYNIHSGMAVGLNFYNDRTGLNQTNSFTATYAYRIEFDDDRKLSFGLGLGGDNISWDLASASTTQANDPAFSTSYSVFKFNGSFGVYYKSNKFYAGFSIPQIFQNTITGPEKGFRPNKFHYYLTTGYYHKVSDRFIFNPSALIKASSNAPIQADVLLRGIFGNVGATLGFRSEMSLIAGIDFEIINRIRIGYAFNYDVGQLARTKGMSHEIALGIGVPYFDNKNGMGNNIYINRKGGYKSNFRRSAGRRGKFRHV
jgi:type IX secretion system PorP/SprF family membrane protein